ncbi:MULTISPECIES: cell division protein FtsQ/DivIB [unclassified Synechococcus]|uniref:cell division protein FtsQ/DivIB n=1 Tax=unclassified Synechococcus TaxID=2626047 RepID=UPI0018CDF115|nr:MULTISPECIES: FtsQ-type POTRA domain-containing protein [unclassified Synechococcus]MEA5422179.1 FtsQ-type POTRA domain-containing protein [Synechococcus sp. CCY9202]QPN58561.1 FtsQ-type POTRA domain-containing protein [Synechococcus sp. CBW1002]QPN65300.1 FtsQ-type POTRA domain-containing protein [Synechococcus sp. CBW1006]CAK6700243.1 Cell division protein FtsQ [Synechococcus sp. CBW1107]
MKAGSLQPGVERRRELRRQRRQERLRNTWRLLVLSGLTAGLGYVLLRQGWTLTRPDQVEVLGSRQVSREQAIQAAGLRFPQPLLTVHPHALMERLAAALPVEKVQVSRLMLPPRLRINLVDRQAVARAERRTPKGLEQGYVDRLGNWMSARQKIGVPSAEVMGLKVVGWNERHRGSLTQLLENRQAIGPDLRQIRFEPDGSLWLDTASLGRIRLGPMDGQLERRLAVLRHLKEELPAQVKGRRVQSIDLSDPNQPELGLPAPARGASAANAPGAPAPVPIGAQ